MSELQQTSINPTDLQTYSIVYEAYGNAIVRISRFQEQMQEMALAFQRMSKLMMPQILATNSIIEEFIKPQAEAINALAEVLRPSLTATNALMEFIKPSIIVREHLVALLKPNLEIVQIFSQGLLFAEVIKQQQQAMETLGAMLANSFSFPRFDIDIIEGHIVGEETKPRAQIVPVPPQAIQIQHVRPILQSRLGIHLFPNGIYKYKRKVLRNLSLNNKAGILLQLFLLQDTHFVTHQQIQKRLGIEGDEAYAANFSHILKYLKKVCRKNGFRLELVNHRGQGYTLIDITMLN